MEKWVDLMYLFRYIIHVDAVRIKFVWFSFHFNPTLNFNLATVTIILLIVLRFDHPEINSYFAMRYTKTAITHIRRVKNPNMYIEF